MKKNNDLNLILTYYQNNIISQIKILFTITFTSLIRKINKLYILGNQKKYIYFLPGDINMDEIERDSKKLIYKLK